MTRWLVRAVALTAFALAAGPTWADDDEGAEPDFADQGIYVFHAELHGVAITECADLTF